MLWFKFFIKKVYYDVIVFVSTCVVTMSCVRVKILTGATYRVKQSKARFWWAHVILKTDIDDYRTIYLICKVNAIKVC